jgi:hypothetical protein
MNDFLMGIGWLGGMGLFTTRSIAQRILWGVQQIVFVKGKEIEVPKVPPCQKRNANRGE